MARRINISIPNQLHRKLKTYKGSIKVSKICQKALSEEIRDIEDRRKQTDISSEMKEIIEKLRNQKNKNEKIIFERGRKDGEEWAKLANYNQLTVAVESLEDDYEEGDYPLRFYILEYLNDRFQIQTDNFLQIDEYIKKVLPQVRIHSNKKNAIEHIYRRGWFRGVMDLWNAVKDEI